jgi:hypothetical protein
LMVSCFFKPNCSNPVTLAMERGSSVAGF